MRTNTRIAMLCGVVGMILAAAHSSSAGEQDRKHPVSPVELATAIRSADKIVVYDSMPTISMDGSPSSPRILFSSANLVDISELREAIVVKVPRSWFLCACYPPVTIELLRRGKNIGEISVHDRLTIGFSSWSGDAELANVMNLLRWFDARGVKGPHQRFREIRARELAERDASVRWVNAAPSRVRPLWPMLMKNPLWWSDPATAPTTVAGALVPELRREFPDSKPRIRALFSWFGTGAGPWSGFPGYEDVAARLLLEERSADLVEALESTHLSESELEGAARFFSVYCSGYLFCPPEANDVAHSLPDDVKISLLEHTARVADQDKIERLKHALQPR